MTQVLQDRPTRAMQLLNFALYQAAWFAGVLGAAHDAPLLGTMVVFAVIAWHLTVSAVFSVLYLGVVAACLGFVLVVWLTRTYSASRVNVFVFLSPVFGVLIGWAALGETVSALQALGALAVAAGILIVTTER